MKIGDNRDPQSHVPIFQQRTTNISGLISRTYGATNINVVTLKYRNPYKKYLSPRIKYVGMVLKCANCSGVCRTSMNSNLQTLKW